ncbi:MAG TPA: carbon-nitrogen hydrolase family protein [Cyclobacteriaceae bacterium]|nr:carbon-nitrogen hydrolase family protein [Cyclobacteriaceae bacterium]
MKTIKLAAAQMTCLDGQNEANLAHATELTLQACEKGAELLLFPEFMTQGYRLTPELWDSAESFYGPTTAWLIEMAKNHNIYIGSSFLESINGHFVNTFALAEPPGKIAGVVRKRFPSMWEAYFFRGEVGPHFIDTGLGRIGVGICFDNHTFHVASAIMDSHIDLMLMPHSYCTPGLPNKMTSQADIDRLNGLPGRVARLYNEMLGVPVLMCNKSGPWNSPVPDTTLGTPKDFRFSGCSVILDSDGKVRAELDDSESIAIGQVLLDPSLKKSSVVPKFSRYIYPGPAGREIIRLMEWRGSLYYRFSKQRKTKASLHREQGKGINKTL